ncbi:substrate-binding domain-containing protein [Actinosynnema sp. NPDC020468]|uniref:substrate-binding domain-containing protein n=1 Tax=Actinosynnema sp. NPDC020468 TaxID=3154488 RepID=UPI0033C90977
MGTPKPAVHRTVLAVDVSAFGGRRPVVQRAVRDGLYASVHGALAECDLAAEHVEDRGDGLFALLDAPKSRVLGRLPHVLAEHLRRHNATCAPAAAIRLRAALTAGSVQHDGNGWVGDDLVLAFRLLDAAPLREASRDSTGVLVLLVSREFFADVVHNDPAVVDRAAFRRVDVAVKEARTEAWLHVPDGRALPPKRHRRPRTGFRRPLPRPRRSAVAVALVLVLLLATDAVAALPVAPTCSDPVQLVVLSSTDKVDVVSRLAVAFERASRKANRLGCKEVDVLVSADRDRDAAEVLGRGWPGTGIAAHGAEPHVWLPDSGFEVARARALLESSTNAVALEDRGPVAHSPLVVGVSREQAGRVGRPDQAVRWHDLGALRFPDPDSGVGMVAAVAAAREALGGVNLAVPDAALRLHGLARRVVDAPGCAGEVAVVGSEAEVTGDRHCQVLYPVDTMVLDHPFVEVRWVKRPPNERRRRVVDRFLEWMRAPTAQHALRGARLRGLDWVAPGPGLRAGRVDPPAVPVDAGRARAAWDAAAAPARIAVADDGSPEAARLLGRLTAEFGPRDSLVRLGPGADTTGVTAVVLLGVPDAPRLARPGGGPVPVVGVGFGGGTCAPSTALYEASGGRYGACYEVVAGAEERVFLGVAARVWGA